MLSTAKHKVNQLLRGPVAAKRLFLFIGLKRSGLHAVSFWILGHQPNHAFINNSPKMRSGTGSYMSRTMQTSPLPLHLYPGYPVAACEGNVEIETALPTALELLIVLFQSQHLWHLKAHETGLTGLESSDVRRILLLRNPFNWAASYMQKSQSPKDSEVWPAMWREYAKEFLAMTNYFPNAIRINYDRWFADVAYRQQLSQELGFRTFTDRSLNLVTSHAGGSSFDRTQFDAEAQRMKVSERWKQYRERPDYLAAFRQNPDIIDMAAQIFEFSPELAEFAASLR